MPTIVEVIGVVVRHRERHNPRVIPKETLLAPHEKVGLHPGARNHEQSECKYAARCLEFQDEMSNSRELYEVHEGAAVDHVLILYFYVLSEVVVDLVGPYEEVVPQALVGSQHLLALVRTGNIIEEGQNNRDEDGESDPLVLARVHVLEQGLAHSYLLVQFPELLARRVLGGGNHLVARILTAPRTLLGRVSRLLVDPLELNIIDECDTYSLLLVLLRVSVRIQGGDLTGAALGGQGLPTLAEMVKVTPTDDGVVGVPPGLPRNTVWHLTGFLSFRFHSQLIYSLACNLILFIHFLKR